MRFNVLVALFVATFVASGGSFITAETDALEDNIYNSNEVARRLRGDHEVQEERNGLTEAAKKEISGLGNVLKDEKAYYGQQSPEMLEYFEQLDKAQLVQNFHTEFGPKGVDRLAKKGVTVEGIVERDPAMMKKLMQLAIKGAKGKTRWFWKILQYVLMTFGVIGVLVVLVRWALKPPPNTTRDSTAKSGKTTTAST
ncbi:unnamed protein product [Peronospora effusa]|uniref:RxLR effector protein n=1 Tax=Peronospora effusa TaxID=542832 RepID=A0A3M6VCP4_9STRA|nr:hypothetical protein DD238_005642 [Peronospora effusa]CAI5714534.1 unnamed protein product [Peronospora effusa]